MISQWLSEYLYHDDVIKWKHFPHYWPFVREPSQRPVTRSSDVFFDLCLNNVWTNNRDAGDLRCHHAHYDIIVMYPFPVIMIYLCGNIHTWLCITSGAYVLCCLCTCAGYIFIVYKHISQINVTAIIKIPFMLENWHYVTGVLRCLKSLGGNSTVCSAAYSN